MNELAVSAQNNLPASFEDLTKFVLIGREKLNAVRAEIRAIKKVGLAEAVRRQKLNEAQAISEAVLDAEVRIGELMQAVSKATGGDHGNQYTSGKINTAVNFAKTKSKSKPEMIKSADDGVGHAETEEIQTVDNSQTSQAEADVEDNSDKPKTKSEIIKEAGFTSMQISRFQQLAAHPEIVEQAKAEAKANDDIVSRSLVLNMIKAKKKADEIEQAKSHIAAQEHNDFEPVLYIGNGIGHNPEEPYDLLLTDPPYSTDIDNIDEFAASWLPSALLNVKSTGSAYVFIGAYPEELKAYLNVQIPGNVIMKQVLIWTYKNTLGNNPKDRYKQNYQACLFYRGVNAPDLDCPLTNEQWAVQEINAPDGRVGDRYHAWQKPMEIAERFIRHSTKRGDTVFDPFACTGTFLLAASKLGRKGYGFEINPENAAIARKRGVKILE